MTATNHALTGAAIGFLFGEPLVAVPAALISHFVCDALPHYGRTLPDSKAIANNNFLNYLFSEVALCFALVAVLAIIHPQNWLLASVCAFIAAAPDFGWINRFMKARQGKTWRPNAFSRWARDIQWFQRPIGWVVELVWFGAAIAIIAPFLK